MKGNMLIIRHVDGRLHDIELKIVPYTDDLHVMQDIVDGWIESLPGDIYFPWVYRQDVIGWCDDMGKMKNKPVTLPVYNMSGKVVDVLVGDILVTGRHVADTCPLHDDAIDELIDGITGLYSRTDFNVRVVDERVNGPQ